MFCLSDKLLHRITLLKISYSSIMIYFHKKSQTVKRSAMCIKKNILKNNETVLVYGAPGCGKTKLLTDLFIDLTTNHAVPPEHLWFVSSKTSQLFATKEILSKSFQNGFSRLNVLSYGDIAEFIIKQNRYLSDNRLHNLQADKYQSSRMFLISKLLENTDLPKDLIPYIKSTRFLNRLNNAISFMEKQNKKINFTENLGWLKKIYSDYKTFCKDNMILFQENLILYAINLLDNPKIILPEIRYFFVDDIQELNDSQYRLLLKFLTITEKMSPKIVITLNNFYSMNSHQRDLSAFIDKIKSDLTVSDDNTFILNSCKKIPNQIQYSINSLSKIYDLTSYTTDDSIECAVTNNSTDEIFHVANKIKSLLKNNVEPNEICIMLSSVRENAHFYTGILKYLGIPSVLEKGICTKKSDVYKFLFSCLMLVNDKNDDTHARRIFHSPVLGINHLEIANIEDKVKTTTLDLSWGIIRFADKISDTRERKLLTNLFLSILDTSSSEPPKSLIDRIVKVSEIVNYCIDTPEIQILNKFISSLTYYENFSALIDKDSNISDFLEHIDFFISEYVKNKETSYVQSVKILSIHNCSAYDFEYIFIPQFDMKNYPATNRDISPPFLKDCIDEKDRPKLSDKKIIINAFTRAKKKIFLSYSRENVEKSPILETILSAIKITPKDSNSGFENYTSTENIHTQIGATVWLSNQTYHLKNADSAKQIVKDTIPQLKTNVPAKILDDLTKISLDENILFSATHLNNYVECPRKFYWEKLIGIRSEDISIFIFGNIMHKTLEIFHTLYPNWNSLSQSEKDAREQFAESLLKQKIDAVHGLSKFEKNILFYQAKNCLGEYFQQLYDELPIKILFIEKKISFSIDGIPLQAKIDRIDDGSENRGYRIIDYKTTSDIKRQVGLKRKFVPTPDKEITDFQLPIYYFAAKEILGIEPTELGIFFLKDTSGRVKTSLRIENPSTGKSVSIEELESVKNGIKNIVNKIKSGHFPCNGKDSGKCFRCDYKWLCE